MQTCASVMTESPAACAPSDTVDRVAQLMRKENVGSIPVVESAGSKRLVGIITDRDIAIRVVAEGRDAKTVRVEEAMSRDPLTCKPDADLDAALKAMEQHQVRRIPVVDADRRLVGIIAQADIARRVGESEKTAELVEEVSRP